MKGYNGISVFEADFDRYTVICSLLGKEKSQFFHDLMTSLEETMKRSVQHHGELCFNWQMSTKQTGNKLEVMFLPKLKVVSERVDMDSPEPSVSEIAKKTGVEK